LRTVQCAEIDQANICRQVFRVHYNARHNPRGIVTPRPSHRAIGLDLDPGIARNLTAAILGKPERDGDLLRAVAFGSQFA
jgi:hypothetical protein